MFKAKKRLEGKLALITGSSRGIGAAIAKKFADEGADLILVARNAAKLEEVDDYAKSKGVHATLVPMDLTDFDKIDQLGGAIYQQWGKLDILVANAAAFGELAPVAHIDPKKWEYVMNLNVNSVYRLIRSLDPLLLASGDANALFISSLITQAHYPYWGLYGCTKAAMEYLVRVYAAEHDGSKLRVNLLSPGPVDTDMLKEIYPGGYTGKNTVKAEDIAKRALEIIVGDKAKNGENILCFTN